MSIYAIITPNKNFLTKDYIIYFHNKEIYDECFILTQEQINTLRLDVLLPEDYSVVFNNAVPSFVLSLANYKVLKNKLLYTVYAQAQMLYLIQNNIIFIYPLMGELYKVDWIKQLNQARSTGRAKIMLPSYGQIVDNNIQPLQQLYYGELIRVIFNSIDTMVDEPISIFNLKVKNKIMEDINNANTEQELENIGITGFKSGFETNSINLNTLCQTLLNDVSVSQEDKNWILTKYNPETNNCTLLNTNQD